MNVPVDVKIKALFKIATTNLSGSVVSKFASNVATTVIADRLNKEGDDIEQALTKTISTMLDRDERSLFDGGDLKSLVAAGGSSIGKGGKIVSMPKNGVIGIWEVEGELVYQVNDGDEATMRKANVGVFGRPLTQLRAFCAELALKEGATYVLVLDAKAIKDNKLDEDVLKRVFDEAREMSSLDGSIVFVNSVPFRKRSIWFK